MTGGFRETWPTGAPASEEPAMLREAVAMMLAGEFVVGKATLCGYIEATVGFAKLAATTGKERARLIRMLSPGSAPRSRDFLPVLGALQKQAGLRLTVGL